MNTKEFLEYMQVFFNAKEYELSRRFFNQFQKQVHPNDTVLIIDILYKIYDLETQFNESHFLTSCTSIERLVEKYETIKFFLRRYDFDIPTDDKEFLSFISHNNISVAMLLHVIQYSMINPIKVINKISLLFIDTNNLLSAARLLNVAYQNSKDENTLFNFSYVLWKSGNFKQAEEVINLLNTDDETVKSLKNMIKRSNQ